MGESDILSKACRNKKNQLAFWHTTVIFLSNVCIAVVMLISDKVYSCRLLCCVSLLQNKSKMLNFSYFVDVLLNAAFSVHHYQVCGYWSRCYQCYSNVFSKPVCANEYDWLKFIEWFHTIKDDDGKLL